MGLYDELARAAAQRRLMETTQVPVQRGIHPPSEVYQEPEGMFGTMSAGQQFAQAEQDYRAAPDFLSRARALMESPMMGVDSGGIGAIIKAYHGSPHNFDKFDISKIGTGEGHQSYGHGLYLAENPKVAETYKYVKSDNPYPSGTPEWHATQKLKSFMGDREQAIKSLDSDLSEGLKSPHWLQNEDIAHNVQMMQTARDLLEGGFNPKIGHLYEVNIDANHPDFLNLDVPITENSPQVREMLIKNNWIGDLADDTGLEFIKGLDPKDHLELGKEGLPGFSYLDQGSRTLGGGTRNYVVLRPELLQIIKKYGIAGLFMGGGAAAYNEGS